MNRSAEVYLPAVAEFPEDLRNRYNLLKPVRLKEYKTGLVLVIRPQGLGKEAIQKQLDNLDIYVKKPEPERPLVIAMHPNMPLTGPNRLNLLTNGAFTQEQIEHTVIDLVAKIPDEITPTDGRVISFHLNTLISPKEWKPDQDYWNQQFEGVLKRVRDISEFSKRQSVNIAVETLPIPEFGDVADKEKKFTDDGHTYWSRLGNPWPLLFWRDEISHIRSAGSRMAIDFCHSFIAMKTLARVEIGDVEERNRLMVHDFDIKFAQNNNNFSEQVINNTKPGDIWHVNDGHLGEGSRTADTPDFFEGITLFEGDIPTKDLKTLVNEGLKKPIKYVIEVNETDFQNSPNTRNSLEKVFFQN